jgi:hypothetical protein
MASNVTKSSVHHSKLFKNWGIDLVALLVIFIFGAFLIGYYSRYDFLNTGYSDWMFHAFRVKSLVQHGFISWDHIWSNGLNHWRGYQFIPHLFAVLLASIFSLGPSRAMMLAVTIVFIISRIFMYLAMRKLGIGQLMAFFATILSYAFIQQWIAVKDYSIFIGLLFWPLYMFLWVMTLRKTNYVYILSAAAGVMWMLHPVIGYSATGLLLCTFLFSSPRLLMRQIVLAILIFAFSSSSFWFPYLFYGYNYANPILSFPQFLRQTLVKEHFGLSLVYWIGIVSSWVIVFLQTGKIDRWAKILLLYLSLYIFVIFIGYSGYLPRIINQLQISRGMVVIGMSLPFVFASCFNTIFPRLESKFVLGLVATIIALTMTDAVEISNQYTGVPSNDVTNPIASYFVNKVPKGSVFFENVAEASYFSPPWVRFVTSYNEHAEPHPLAQRFRKLVANDLSYTGVSGSTLQLINAYCKVLGVEYIFVPHFSSLITDLTDKEKKDTVFVIGDDVIGETEQYRVLRNAQPFSIAYLADVSTIKEGVSFELFRKPDLRVETFGPWDTEVLKENEFLDSKKVTGLQVDFLDTDGLKISLPADQKLQGRGILVYQSFDDYWGAENVKDIKILPTSLRMMYVELPSNFQGKELILRHHWPVWYWPIQGLSVFTFVFIGLLYVFDAILKKAKL